MGEPVRWWRRLKEARTRKVMRENKGMRRHRMTPTEREAAQWYIDHSMDLRQADTLLAYLKRTEADHE